MSVIGIVCEYNPFHNGHKYLIDSVKTENDIVVAVMSGNFVQRAEPAIFPKEARAKSALMNGVDIVIELPFVYATASAELFARSAVTLLDSIGCDKIAFGAENGDIEKLSEAAKILSADEFDLKIKKYLDRGVSYSSARQSAFDEYNIDCDISSPNNILALEYMKAIDAIGSEIIPIAVKRLGAGYNDKTAVGAFASATHIRELIYRGEAFCEYVPSNTVDIYCEALKSGDYVSLDKYNLSSLTLLREKLPDDLSSTANMAEGLENRIKSAVKESLSLSEIYDTAKTKRYAHSRIRRAALSVCFDIKSDDLKVPVPYIRLLGFNEAVRDKIGLLSKNAKLPFVTTYKDIRNAENARRIFELQNKSTDFYNLVLQKPRKCSAEMTFSPIKLK